MHEYILFNLGSIILLGIGAQWLAWRMKMPSILFLLIFGFIAGPITGFLHPDELMGEMLLPFVALAVAVILFEGGLTLNIKELREIGGVVFGLVSVGAFITWITISLAAFFVLKINLSISVLLGAILVVTGPTVIGPLLRHVRPTTKVADILKWEGIVIDPIGAMLAVLVFEVVLVEELQHATTIVLISLGKIILFGSLTGFAFAWLLVFLLKRFWIPDFLHVTMTLSFVVAAYIASDVLQSESGLFATTIMGIMVGNQKYITVKHILEFKENLRVLIISALFIVLSARLSMDVFNVLSFNTLIFLSILFFVARPLSVFASSIKSSLSRNEKLFLSWLAPRGIVAASVSSIFALRLAEAGVEQAELLVPFTFIVIVVSVAIYGLTSLPVALALGVAHSESRGVLIVGAHPWALEMAKTIKLHGFAVAIIDTNRANVIKARMSDVPAYYGSVFSEQILDNVNLDGIGRMLALTSNDEANSMAVLHFNEVFDRQELYQLVPETDKKKSEKYSPKHLRGRYLFKEGLDYAAFTNRYFLGAIIKSTKLTKDFEYKKYRYGRQKICTVCRNKKLLD